MFVRTETAQMPLRPSKSEIHEKDWAVLARMWHPVAALPELEDDKPFSVRLLDVDLVVYTVDGKVTVALDRCPHRWIKLSAGEMIDGKIVCKFHGLAFDGAGQCVSVPALGRDARLPTSYRLRTFRSQIRYGLVWVCLDDASSMSMPHFELFDGHDESAMLFFQVREWPMSAPRQIENFIDLAHLPWIHATTLGGDPHGRMQPARIEHTNDAVIMTANFVETVPFDKPTNCELIYRVHLPFAIDFSTTPIEEVEHRYGLSPDSKRGKGFRSINLAAPTTHNTCRVYQFGVRGKPGETFPDGPKMVPTGDYALLLSQQDIDMLEQLAISDLPLTEKLEIHLPVDNVSIAYRERLRALGLGAS